MKKICSCCGLRKLVSAFSLRKDGGSRDGHQGQCRKCQTEKARVWRKKYPDGVAPLARYRRRYAVQKGDAKRRGILFALTFEQWLNIWRRSGHLDDSGSYHGHYHMARTGDKGAYEVGNVRICPAEENHSEKRHTLAAKEKIRQGNIRRWQKWREARA